MPLLKRKVQLTVVTEAKLVGLEVLAVEKQASLFILLKIR